MDPGEAPATSPHGLTIDELARQAQVTSRNVRAYQERGLLPGPRKVGRTGYYDETHVARLRGITSLLGRGYSLAAIGELLTTWERGEDVAQLLGLEEAVGRPWSEEPTVRLSADELAARFPPDLVLLERALALGLLEVDGDSFLVPSMQLLEAGAQLIGAGIPPAEVIEQAAALMADAERIAERFVNLFLDHVWNPFVEQGMDPVELPRIIEQIDRLRPLANQAILPVLAQAMERQVGETVERVLATLPHNDPEAAADDAATEPATDTEPATEPEPATDTDTAAEPGPTGDQA
ncbi:MAG TPA: MerR family transcriptional regulator [Acidimicrobiales bacterium]